MRYWPSIYFPSHIWQNATAATSLQETISQLIVDYWQDNLGYLLGSDNQDTRFNLLKQVYEWTTDEYRWCIRTIPITLGQWFWARVSLATEHQWFIGYVYRRRVSVCRGSFKIFLFTGWTHKVCKPVKVNQLNSQYYNCYRIMLNDDIPVHRKLPFARLLTWTHLNTERDSLFSCIQLAECRSETN